MDSNRRHDLETNDLKEFLDNFKDFWDKHGNKVLIVLIAALLIYAGPRYYKNWQVGKANDAAGALEAATSANALLGVANEHEIVRDEATRRAADLFFREANDAKVGDDETAEKAWGSATSAYTTLAESGQTVVYQIIGYEGLAKVAQEQGDADQAKANYEKVIELAGDTYVIFAKRAERALELLPAVSNPVAFSPPPPVSIDPITPGLGPGPTDPLGPALPGLGLPDIGNPIPGLPPLDPAPTEPSE